MPKCEFSEGQFEQSLLLDFERIGVLGGPHFRPSAGLETYMPFDLGINLDPRHAARIWRHGRMFTVRGLPSDDFDLVRSLPPKHAFVVPHDWINLFLQTKVPEHIERTNSKTAKQWDFWQRPYFRITLDNAQHGKLISLEQRLASRAVVRYAAPAFFEWTELRTRESLRSVTDGTHFQSPSRLGSHLAYTFTSAMAPGAGFSEPEEIDTSSIFSDVSNALRKADEQPLAVGFSSVWRALREGVEIRPSAKDYAVTRRTLGLLADTPLDRHGVLADYDENLRDFLPEGSRASFGSFFTSLLVLERYIETHLGLRWIVVGS